jgi:hypothetical protein
MISESLFGILLHLFSAVIPQTNHTKGNQVQPETSQSVQPRKWKDRVIWVSVALLVLYILSSIVVALYNAITDDERVSWTETESWYDNTPLINFTLHECRPSDSLSREEWSNAVAETEQALEADWRNWQADEDNNLVVTFTLASIGDEHVDEFSGHVADYFESSESEVCA